PQRFLPGLVCRLLGHTWQCIPQGELRIRRVCRRCEREAPGETDPHREDSHDWSPWSRDQCTMRRGCARCGKTQARDAHDYVPDYDLAGNPTWYQTGACTRCGHV